LKIFFLEGISSAMIGAIAGAIAGAVFGIFWWYIHDYIDLKNHKKIIYEELKKIEDTLYQLDEKDLDQPFTILYPKKGRLYDVKLGFIRLKENSENLNKIYDQLLKIDEKFQIYKNLPKEERKEESKMIYNDIKTLRTVIRDTLCVFKK
jgi:hypothetical protein